MILKLNGVSVGGCNLTAYDYDCTFVSCNGKNGNGNGNGKKDVVIFATSHSIAVTATYQKHSKDCDCARWNADGECSKENTLVDRFGIVQSEPRPEQLSNLNSRLQPVREY